MNITFKQGIIKYPSSNSIQTFLSQNGNNINLSADNGSILINFSHGNSNYTFEEFSNIQNAWIGPFNPGTDYWLYWDIDRISGNRTFGYTTLRPKISATRPLSAEIGQHWYDLSNNKMYVKELSIWRNVIRVFASQYDGLNFLSMGSGTGIMSFAGSQVGINNISDVAGKILYFNNKPVLKQSKEFFTTESVFNINGSNIDSLRLESSYTMVKANETLPKYHIVKYIAENIVELANYNDTNNIIGIITEDTIINNITNIILSGIIINTSWNWLDPIGSPLWINSNGELTSTDPHLVNNVLYPIKYNPIAKILSPTSIILQQSMN